MFAFPHFTSIYNLRKPSDKLPLFRYAALDHSFPEEVDKLITSTRIAYRIDLRSPLEVLRSERQHVEVPPRVKTTLLSKRILRTESNQVSDGHPHSRMTLAASVATRLRPTDAFKVTRKKRAETEKLVYHHTMLKQGKRVEIFNVNFINLNYIDKSVWDRCTFMEKMKMLSFMITFRFEALIAFVGTKLQQGGLAGSYRDFLDHSGQPIFQALRLITESLEKQNGNVGVNCQFGKDRTGMIVALVKHVAGDSHEDIFADYAKSQQGFPAGVRASMLGSFKEQGLPESFADSPEQVMKDTFDYLVAQYGSVDGYLDHIGFDEAWRERLLDVVVFV